MLLMVTELLPWLGKDSWGPPGPANPGSQQIAEWAVSNLDKNPSFNTCLAVRLILEAA